MRGAAGDTRGVGERLASQVGPAPLHAITPSWVVRDATREQIAHIRQNLGLDQPFAKDSLMTMGTLALS